MSDLSYNKFYTGDLSGFEPENLAIRGDPLGSKRPPVTKPSKSQRSKQFLKGPVPWDWLAAASRLPGKCAQVGLVLWFLSGLRKSRTVRLGNKFTGELGVSRDAKRRALNRLENARLISVKRQVRRAPMVTLLEVLAACDQVEPNQ